MRTLLFVLLLPGVPLFGQSISFRANRITNLPSNGNSFSSILQGDFTNDGKRDVVAVANDEIVVYPGTGGDSLGAPIITTLPSLNYATAVAGDFNHDGFLDLVLMESVYPTNVYQFVTMLGNGTGTFTSSATSVARLKPTYLITADLNGDGIPDIAWVSGNGIGSETLEVQLGLGNGAFDNPISETLPAQVWGITKGDFNGDGIIDLALLEGPPSYAEDVQILFGNGAGSFPVQELLTFNIGTNLVSLAAGYLNSDRHLDLVVATATGYAVILGAGNGVFAAPQQYPAGTGGTIALADIDGDRKLDILLTNSGYLNGVVYAIGNGDGTFGPSLPTFQEAAVIATGDLNDDGIADVAALLQHSEVDIQVTILLGSHLGLVVAPTIPLSVTAYSGPVTADFNHDGKADFGIVTESGIAVFLGDGDGRFRPSALLAGIPYGIAVGDFNGDGITDIAEGLPGNGFGPGFVDLFLGKGDGTFASPVVSPGPPVPSFPVAADLNRDGKLDIVFVSDPGYNPYAKGYVVVQLGNGDGTFSAPVSYTGNDFPNALAVADFDGDGVPDIAFSNYYSGTISLLTGKGDGSFLAAVTLATTSSPYQIQAADVNRDGRPDLVVGTSATVNVYLNEGNGVFQLAATNAPFGYGLVVADLDGDGIPDLAASTGTAVSVQRGKGDGSFQDPTLYGVFAGQMAVGSFHGGTLPDVSMTNESGGVTFLVNTSGKPVCTASSAPAPYSPACL